MAAVRIERVFGDADPAGDFAYRPQTRGARDFDVGEHFAMSSLGPVTREARAAIGQRAAIRKIETLRGRALLPDRPDELPDLWRARAPADSASRLPRSGGNLRLAPVFALGRPFSGLLAIQPDHRLVADGIYGVIRHSSYLGLQVTTVG
jgi:hypothetical protein